VTSGLYDAFRAAGVDLLRAHRLDAYLRAMGDEAVTDGFARTLQGEDADLERLRAALVADLDGIVAGLALLDGASRLARL
jgi:hypothetical protein